jgi:5-deoxy-glucuronate isomerase
MRIRQKEPFGVGYNSITEQNGKHSDMMMDFGILKLGANTKYEDDAKLEKVYLLLYGEVKVVCGENSYTGRQ